MPETLISLAKKVPTEAAAWKYLERRRWNGKPVCPHCGVIDGHYLLRAKATTATGRKSYRRVWKCHACRKQFTVLVGTVMQGTHIPIRTWLFVLMEMCANKNGLTAREVQRKYGLTPKSAWFLTQRIGNIGTNAAESYFSQLKRSIDGTFHALSHKHLGRYLAEFDYRHSTRKMHDDQRLQKLLDRFAGVTLTYDDLVAA